MCAALLTGMTGCERRWTMLTSEQAGFSISMPSPPTEREWAVGARRVVGFRSQGAGCGVIGVGLVYYTVTYSDVSDAPSTVGKGALLERQKESMVREVDARVVSERPMKLNGHEGLQFRLETPYMISEQRLLLVDGRLYELGVSWERRWGCSPDAEMFFDSFHSREGPRT